MGDTIGLRRPVYYIIVLYINIYLKTSSIFDAILTYKM